VPGHVEATEQKGMITAALNGSPKTIAAHSSVSNASLQDLARSFALIAEC